MRYTEELNRLRDSYKRTCAANLQAMQTLFAGLADRSVVFVGSGGALAVAQLAADIHTQSSGCVARAVTPLELPALGVPRAAGLVLFTARARHRDASFAVEVALRAGYDPVAVVTHQRDDELPTPLDDPRVQVATLPQTTADGFLATNSVLSMAVAVLRCYGLPATQLPRELIARLTRLDETRPRWLILYGPQHRAAAVDLETRVAETGLACAQVTDYRNLAHGRHSGLARHAKTTLIVALVGPEDESLVDLTLRGLPTEISMTRLSTPHTGSVGTLALFVANMRLIEEEGRRQGIDPARPGVRKFGRRLYHLSARRHVGMPTIGPVDRKLAAAGFGPGEENQRGRYKAALAEWLEQQAHEPLGAIVLDYDGTCCQTEARLDPPPSVVQTAILKVLGMGLLVGFASGRGKSLIKALRQWVPPEMADQVIVGLYNGGLVIRLDEPVPDQENCQGDLRSLVARLRSYERAKELDIEARTSQVKIEPSPAHGPPLAAVAAMIETAIASPPALPLRTVTSGHSVDVLPIGITKGTVIDVVRKRSGRTSMAIGDQGAPGGNDFDLLSWTAASVSVDQVSADPTRCWNLDERGHRGPELLVQYLHALRSTPRGVRFRWRRA